MSSGGAGPSSSGAGPSSSSVGPLERDPSKIISLAEFFDFLSCAYKLSADLSEKAKVKPARVSWDDLSSNRLIGKLLSGGAGSGSGSIASSASQSYGWRIPGARGRSRRSGGLSAPHEDPLVELNRAQSQRFTADEIADRLNATLDVVLDEGILDSVMPFIVPKLNFVETAVKVKNMEHSKRQEELHIQQTTKEYLGIMRNSKMDKMNDVEIEIQVCDEIRHKTKVFKCPRSLLLSQMAYFNDVTSGQRLEDMDISVHCDLTIFDWLMKWVKSTTTNENVPMLHNLNVIPVLVSATFLQMDPLIHECISYFKANMDDVIRTASPNLSCLNDAVIAKIADALTNLELDGMDDQKDKIQSRLFCKFIMLLSKKEPQYFRGHFSSISSLFKCNRCKKILHSHFACWIPCLQSNVKLDSSGIMQALHEMDEYWNINFFIKDLKNEVKSWRKVYWRVWSTCHYLKCQNCSSYYPVKSTNWCRHHEELPQFFPAEEGKHVSIVGKYMCCGQKTYRFEILPTFTGCEFRPHQPLIPPHQQAIIRILEKKADFIFVNPPRLSININLLEDLEHYGESISKVREEPTSYHEFVKNEYFSWYNLQVVPAFVPAHLLKEPPSADTVDEQEDDDFQDTEESGSSSSKNTNQHQYDPKKEYYSSTDDIDSSSMEDEDMTDEDPPAQPNFPPKCCRHYRNCMHKRKQKYNRKWMPKLSVRCNQDNQREREERLMKSYIQKLSRRSVNQDLNKIQKCTVVIPRTCMTSNVPIADDT